MQILLDKHEHPIMIIAEIKNMSDKVSLQLQVKVTFAAKRHSVHDNGNGSNGDDGCGGTADAGVILSVIIHMYKNKNTPNEPGDENDSAESSA